jgi:hypothetical protein
VLLYILPFASFTKMFAWGMYKKGAIMTKNSLKIECTKIMYAFTLPAFLIATLAV